MAKMAPSTTTVNVQKKRVTEKVFMDRATDWITAFD